MIDHIISPDILWKPLFESAAKTMIGALSAYSAKKMLSKLYASHTYDGGMDIWARGFRSGKLQEGDTVAIDGLISPYSQLFPGDPYQNAKRWNSLYSFSGKISSGQYQTLEFFAGSDAALRIGSLNGETLVGIYNRYGFIGEGLIGVIPTRYLLNRIPDFFRPDFTGVRAVLKGRVSKCPSQHAFVAQAIAKSINIDLDIKNYRELWYLQIDTVSINQTSRGSSTSLLGLSWVATHKKTQQYVTQYGYLSDPSERQQCITQIIQSEGWRNASVFYDDIASPSKSLSFKSIFLT